MSVFLGICAFSVGMCERSKGAVFVPDSSVLQIPRPTKQIHPLESSVRLMCKIHIYAVGFGVSPFTCNPFPLLGQKHHPSSVVGVCGRFVTCANTPSESAINRKVLCLAGRQRRASGASVPDEAVGKHR